MNESCLFCRIIAGQIPATFVYRDDEVVAIADVNPQAPSHVLVMPATHHENLGAFVSSATAGKVAQLFAVADKLGAELGDGGYRTVINTGQSGGQTVDHLHVHVLSGRQMHWPPG